MTVVAGGGGGGVVVSGVANASPRRVFAQAMPVVGPNEWVNPHDFWVNPHDFRFRNSPKGSVAYVLVGESRTRPTRVMTADVPSGIRLDDVVLLFHAKSGMVLGTYRVSGIARRDNGVLVGEVPDRLIRHCVLQSARRIAESSAKVV